ncbi:hypothetical protein [Maribacter sp.]|uniref:hypothetical protein n=1 Tax=Maribacter sp. TaxID=1897614 RepID=UPI0025BC76DB|nr:hypothetical protein [Maribacter sp.]
MKKFLLFGLAITLLTGCSGVKKTQEAINTGNYTQAINTSIVNLSSNKTKKSNQPYILLLEEVFAKNTEREMDRIAFYKKDGNPANLESVYNGYYRLKLVQEQIKPLLPLQIYEEGREAKFQLVDYDQKIINTKQELSNYLYTNANNLLKNASNKFDYRKSYNDFTYLSKINPGFLDTKTKMEEALAKGINYVSVAMSNNTNIIIPEKLEAEMLNLSTYGLNKLWTEYHTNPLPNVIYDYNLDVSFEDIAISPEQINEKQIIKEKQIKDGYEYLTNSDGNVVKDSLGNMIKVDKFKTVRCNYYQFTQFKSTQVTGLVSFTDNIKKQQIDQYPLTSEFVFEHIYANYHGDKRALDNDLTPLLKLGAVPFPTNEQMVYDTGEDLKAKLKYILQQQNFN